MPIRKVPKNAVVVTGRFASSKNTDIQQFESLLERDLMILLEFDPAVASFEPQPVRIPVPGIAQGYVPDLRVVYKDKRQEPEIVEVKPTEFLKRFENEYAAKFAVAERYCTDIGHRFVIKTELDIRTERLKNLKFLRGYKHVPVGERQRREILAFVNEHEFTSSEAILEAFAGEDRRELLPIIWSMLLTGDLCSDLDSAWPVDVPVWSL